MAIERLSFPAGKTLDIQYDLQEQVDEIINKYRWKSVTLPTGLHLVTLRVTPRSDPLFIAQIEQEGNAICLKPEGIEIYDWQRKMEGASRSLLRKPAQYQVMRMPEDQNEYILTAMVISGSNDIEPQLKLFEYFFHRPGPSPRRK